MQQSGSSFLQMGNISVLDCLSNATEVHSGLYGDTDFVQCGTLRIIMARMDAAISNKWRKRTSEQLGPVEPHVFVIL